MYAIIQTLHPKSVFIYLLVDNAQLRPRVSNTATWNCDHLSLSHTAGKTLHLDIIEGWWGGKRWDALLTLAFLCYFHETEFQSALFFKSANRLYIVKDQCFHG